jgi:hypothetical protein
MRSLLSFAVLAFVWQVATVFGYQDAGARPKIAAIGVPACPIKLEKAVLAGDGQDQVIQYDLVNGSDKDLLSVQLVLMSLDVSGQVANTATVDVDQGDLPIRPGQHSALKVQTNLISEGQFLRIGVGLAGPGLDGCGEGAVRKLVKTEFERPELLSLNPEDSPVTLRTAQLSFVATGPSEISVDVYNNGDSPITYVRIEAIAFECCVRGDLRLGNRLAFLKTGVISPHSSVAARGRLTLSNHSSGESTWEIVVVPTSASGPGVQWVLPSAVEQARAAIISHFKGGS